MVSSVEMNLDYSYSLRGATVTLEKAVKQKQ